MKTNEIEKQVIGANYSLNNSDYLISFEASDALGMLQVESAFKMGITFTNIEFSNGTILPMTNTNFEAFAVWFAEKQNKIVSLSNEQMTAVVYPAYPVVQATSSNTFLLDKAYRIKGIEIPQGFESDGLTLKIRILRLIVSKYAPKLMPFFFIHDYLCTKEKYRLADDLGSKVLFEIEKSWRTKAMMKAIRIYHKIKYGI